MSSMSREPMWCSAVPTHRKSKDLATAWNSSRNMPAQMASGVPTPAQAVIRPRLAIVEYASTRFALLWEMAMNEHSRNVMPPTSTTMTLGTSETANTGASLQQQEDARFDHRGGMEQRRGGRGCHHGAQQPGVERHLRGLRDAGERQQDRGQRRHGRERVTQGDELLKGEDAQGARGVEQRQDERDAADHVHDDLAEGVADGLVGLGVADEQEGAHRGDLPARKQPRHVVREDDQVHGGQEQEHEGEEQRTAVL